MNDHYSFYPHPLTVRDYTNALPYREQYLRAFSIAVRSKPNWTEKVLDRSLVAKWFREAQAEDNAKYGEHILAWNRRDVEFLYAELLAYRGYAVRMKEEGVPIEPDLDNVWKADGMIDEALRQELIDGE